MAEIWLTQEAYDRLKAELEQLEGPARVEIAKRIEIAREEGDLRENGGYHAAKEEQGKIEARIRELSAKLKDAVVGEAPDVKNGIAAGMVVTAKILGDDAVFLLGSREMAGDADIDVYSEGSPLGQAIIGKQIGDSTQYTAPNGRIIPVEIIDAKPYQG